MDKGCIVAWVLSFTTQLHHFLVYVFLFALFSDELEVFLSKYSQIAKLHAAQFRWVVKAYSHCPISSQLLIETPAQKC